MRKTRFTLHKREKRRVYEIKFSPVIGFILKMAGGVRGYKIDQRFEVPEWIRNGNKRIKSYFLRGIFDDEATVNYTKKKHARRIVFAMGKRIIYKNSMIKFMKQIKKLLAEFNIYAGKIKTQETYEDKIILRFGIYKKINFENFLHNIGFTHKRKCEILKTMISNYIDPHISKKNILKVLVKSPRPLAINEIAEKTKLKNWTVKFHLYGLRSNLMVERIDGRPHKWF